MCGRGRDVNGRMCGRVTRRMEGGKEDRKKGTKQERKGRHTRRKGFSEGTVTRLELPVEHGHLRVEVGHGHLRQEGVEHRRPGVDHRGPGELHATIGHLRRRDVGYRIPGGLKRVGRRWRGVWVGVEPPIRPLVPFRGKGFQTLPHRGLCFIHFLTAPPSGQTAVVACFIHHHP